MTGLSQNPFRPTKEEIANGETKEYGLSPNGPRGYPLAPGHCVFEGAVMETKERTRILEQRKKMSRPKRSFEEIEEQMAELSQMKENCSSTNANSPLVNHLLANSSPVEVEMPISPIESQEKDILLDESTEEEDNPSTETPKPEEKRYNFRPRKGQKLCDTNCHN